MHLINKIKIEKHSTEIPEKIEYLQWTEDGIVTVNVPLYKEGWSLLKNKIIKNDYVLTLLRGRKNWKLKLKYENMIFLSIIITKYQIYKEFEFTTTVSRVKFNSDLTIEAPLIIVKGSNNATNLNFISETSIFIYGNIASDKLELKATENVQIFLGAIIQCQKFQSNSVKCFHYGSICNLLDDKILELNIVAEIFHLNAEGNIGIRNRHFEDEKYCSNVIKGEIKASIRNFGKFFANSEIILNVEEILSVKDCMDFVAQRHQNNVSWMSSSQSIKSYKVTDSLLSVTQNVSSKSNLQNAMLFSSSIAYGKRIRGSIEAKVISLNVENSIDDLAQIICNHLTLSIGSNCKCEKLSEVFGETLTMNSSKNFEVFGNLNFNKIIIFAQRRVFIGKEGIINATDAKITVENVENVKNGGFVVKGLLEAKKLELRSSGYFSIGGKAHCETKNAYIYSNIFYNAGTLNATNDLYLNLGKFVQNNHGKIKAANIIHFDGNCGKRLSGFVEAKLIRIVPRKRIIINGLIYCENCEVIINDQKAIFKLNNSSKIIENFVVIQEEKVDSSNLQKIYNIQINGNLSAKNILAGNSPIFVGSKGCIQLKCPKQSQLHADALFSSTGSVIAFPAERENEIPSIGCNRTWYCKGDVIKVESGFAAQKDNKTLSFNGFAKADKVIFKSSLQKEEIEINGLIIASKIIVLSKAKNVTVTKISLIDCQNISVECEELKIDGDIYQKYFGAKQLEFQFDVKRMFLNGNIGSHKNEWIVPNIKGQINGDFVNCGSIESRDLLELKLQNLLSADTEASPKIVSDTVKICVEENIENCSQITGNSLEINAKGDVYCDENTTWKSGIVNLKIGRDLKINGNIEFKEAQINVIEKFVGKNDSVVKIDTASISTQMIEHYGKWESENLTIEKTEKIKIIGEMTLGTAVFEFSKQLLFYEDSLVQANISKISSSNDTESAKEIIFKGQYNTQSLEVERIKDLNIFETSKIKVSDIGRFSTQSLENYGELSFEKTAEIKSEIVTNHGLFGVGENLNIFAPVSITNSKNGAIKMKDGEIATNNFDNFGKVEVKENLDLTATSFSQNGTIICEEKFNLKAKEAVTNYGIIKPCKKLFISSFNFINSSGAEINAGDCELKVESSFENSGIFITQNNLNLVATSILQNENGKIRCDGNITVNVDTVINNGLIHCENDVKFSGKVLKNLLNGKIFSNTPKFIMSEKVENCGTIIAKDNIEFSTINFVQNKNAQITSDTMFLIESETIINDGSIKALKLELKTQNLNNLTDGSFDCQNGIFCIEDFENGGSIKAENEGKINSKNFKQLKEGILSSENKLIAEITENFHNYGTITAAASFKLYANVFHNFENAWIHILNENNQCDIDADTVIMNGEITVGNLHIKCRKKFAVPGNFKCNSLNLEIADNFTVLEIDGKIYCKTELKIAQNETKNDSKNILHLKGTIITQCLNAKDTVITLNPKSSLCIHNENLNDLNEEAAILCDSINLQNGSMLAVQKVGNHRRVITCLKDWIQNNAMLIQIQNVKELKDKENPENAIFQGDVVAKNVIIKSDFENVDLKLEGSVTSQNVKLSAFNGKVSILPKTEIKCDEIKVNASEFLVFGQISGNTNLLEINVDAEKMIIGSNGILGNEKINKISLKISGDLINFNQIIAKINVEIFARNLLSSKTFHLTPSGYENEFHQNSKSQITAKKVKIVAEDSIEDCGQLYANFVDICAKERIICEKNTELKAEGITVSTKGHFVIDGEIDCDRAKMRSNFVTLSPDGNVRAETTTLEASNIKIDGEWIGDNFTVKMMPEDDEIPRLFQSKEYSQFAQRLEQCHNELFIIEKNGNIYVQNAEIFTKFFQNFGNFEIQSNLQLYCHSLKQENGAFVSRDQATLYVTDVPRFNGILQARNLKIHVHETFLSSAEIKAKQTNITFFDSKNSLFELNNFMSVEKQLTVTTLDKKTESENANGFIIKGNLIAETLESDVILRLEENGKIFLQKKSIEEIKPTILNIDSISVKPKAILKAIDYQGTPVIINVGNTVMFDGILLESGSSKREVDCLPYIDKEQVNRCTPVIKFLAFLKI